MGRERAGHNSTQDLSLWCETSFKIQIFDLKFELIRQSSALIFLLSHSLSLTAGWVYLIVECQTLNIFLDSIYSFHFCLLIHVSLLTAGGVWRERANDRLRAASMLSVASCLRPTESGDQRATHFHHRDWRHPRDIHLGDFSRKKSFRSSHTRGWLALKRKRWNWSRFCLSLLSAPTLETMEKLMLRLTQKCERCGFMIDSSLSLANCLTANFKMVWTCKNDLLSTLSAGLLACFFALARHQEISFSIEKEIRQSIGGNLSTSPLNEVRKELSSLRWTHQNSFSRARVGMSTSLCSGETFIGSNFTFLSSF